MFVNSAVSQYPSLAFQFAFDQAGENFHIAALMLRLDEDSGQATPLLSKEFLDDIMAGHLNYPAIKNDPGATCIPGIRFMLTYLIILSLRCGAQERQNPPS